jgi:hypothetical protein
MKKSSILAFLGMSFFFVETIAQNVAINNDGSLPFVGAMIDVKSTNKGILVPRIALTGTNDITTIPNRTPSLLIYNTATVGGGNPVTPGYYYWNGSTWIRLITLDNFATGPWVLGGNAGTSPATHFIGTTDNNSLQFKLNNQKAGFIGIESNANVLLGYQSGNNITTGFSNVGI